MFTRGGVTLRPLEPEDVSTLYVWHQDYELDVYASWDRKLSRAAFQQKIENQITTPRDDLVVFGIEAEGVLVGTIMLGMIDQEQRRAALGIVLGDRDGWGRGISKTAIAILLDYAFTVKNLDRVYAEAYGFNTRSQRLLETTGFQSEGILRQHELHNGRRHDMHQYGILKDEFYARYRTQFTVPELEASEPPDLSHEPSLSFTLRDAPESGPSGSVGSG